MRARTGVAVAAWLLGAVAVLAASRVPARATSRIFAFDIRNGALIVAQPTIEPSSSGQA